jgi:hypothetical protein
MKNFELEELFNKFLKRKPNNEEYDWHLSKKYDDFVKEIKKCNEYLELQKKLALKECKIAILISGHIRNNNVEKSLHLLKDYDFDIFVHTWDNLGFKGNETKLNDTINLELIENTVKKLPNIKDYKIENNKTYINSLDLSNVDYFNYSSPEVFLKSQLYSINQSYKIFENYYLSNNLTYDIVIRTRFENVFTKFNIDGILLDNIKNYDIIFTPNRDCGHHHPDSNSTTCLACEKMFYEHNLKYVHSFNHTNVICDIFSYGSVNSMKKYCSLYENFEKLNKEFENENKKILLEKNIKHTKKDNVCLLDRGVESHLDSLYYINCSYPERLLQFQLKNYLLPSSTMIKIDWKR